MSLAVYYAPTYFSTFYFPSLVQLYSVPPAPSLGGYRDRDAFEAIVDALEQTQAFGRVLLGGNPSQASVSADQNPLAVIVPDEWTEMDDIDPIVNLRTVSFRLTIVVRSIDIEDRFQQIDRLTSLVQNALDGSDLNGGCLPGLTKLKQGRYEARPSYPEQSVTLNGTFAYLITGQTGHGTSE